MLVGSLDLLAQTFPDSRFSVAPLVNLGQVSEAATAILEGALFAAAVVGAMHLMQRGRQ